MIGDTPIDVMLVEDSAVTRGLIARGLGADAGLRVCGMAGNGREALDLLQTQNPRVIVLDIEMPVMNGLEALPKILAKRPNTVVIMASALTRRHAAMSLKALELGAADCAEAGRRGGARRAAKISRRATRQNQSADLRENGACKAPR